MTTYTATYSPDDNRLRLSCSQRLDPATYARVKAAGFIWAPKQEQFIAPMWTPQRADLCIELAGEIGDEDSTLMDRAEVRADRFEEYSDKRADEARAAREAVRRIMDCIPMGQPILIGHHSQAHAERHAKQIERGMQRAVDRWETHNYWQRRAAAAIRHAAYKERPDVRHRRIRTIEADARKHRKTIEDCEKLARIWAKTPRLEWDKQTAFALFLAGRTESIPCGVNDAAGYPRSSLYSELEGGRMHGDQAWRLALEHFGRRVAWASRWLEHYEHRLAYERAMLDEAGGLAADKFDIQPGGRVLIGSEWLPVLRVNKSGGRVVSVTVTGSGFVPVRGIEEVKDYKPPTEEDAAKVAKVSKLAPLCNYRTEGCREMTADEWKTLTARTDSAFVAKIKATETHGEHRHRSCSGPNWTRLHVFITDMAEKPAPKLGEVPKKRAGVAAAAPWNKDREPEPAPAPVSFERQREPAPLPAPKPQPTAEAQEFAAMRQSLREGVQTISAPQLFPTPPELAARMVEAADIRPGDRWLEPSAGTGRLVDAVAAVVPLEQLETVLVEVNHGLSESLAKRMPAAWTLRADFLEIGSDELQRFDVILMNPPFSGGADVQHITRALWLLAPGGRLVAVASAGLLFRQDRATRHLREHIARMGGTIEELPPGTFESSGTGVNTVLVTATAAGERRHNAGRPAHAQPEGLPDPRPWFELNGRFYRVLAEFDAADVAGANAYMHTHDGASLLATYGGRLILAHKDDEGTKTPPAIDDEAAAQPDEGRARVIAANVYEKRAGWADDGKPTAADLEEHAGKLEAAALQLDGDGCHQTAANYRRAAVLLRERKPAPPARLSEEETAAMLAKPWPMPSAIDYGAKALQIIGRMSAVDLFDYLADHASEPPDGARTFDAMRAAVIANVAEIGAEEFCRRMQWVEQAA